MKYKRRDIEVDAIKFAGADNVQEVRAWIESMPGPYGPYSTKVNGSPEVEGYYNLQVSQENWSDWHTYPGQVLYRVSNGMISSDDETTFNLIFEPV